MKCLGNKGKVIANLSEELCEATLAMFGGNLDSRRLFLEDEDPKEILAEPGSSLRLVRHLQWKNDKS